VPDNVGSPDDFETPDQSEVHDDFEQELTTNIAEADAIGESELAAQWRLQLNSYRAAKEQASVEGPAVEDP
jgi:hypothetical protein